MARIPNEVINEIRQKARIEDIISQYIEVIRKGNSYVAVCPFHDDHDPSLHISPSKQIFKCFVCDSAGDVFSFVQKYEGISYVQAIRKVADLIGYKYDFGSEYDQPVFQETEVHKIMREAVTFCQHELSSEAGQKAKEYLANRGLSPEQLERFQFGYNPPKNALYTFLNRKGYQDKDIIQANVGRLTENGVADVFYDRITIPIHDREGHPIGFTARSMDPHAESKYINSTDTPVYHKSEVLFNYHRAVNQIRKDKYAILAEGPMDVMAFDAAGFSNAVCSLGTSCTKEQLQQLKKLTGSILMAYDGDKAGQNAIYRGGLLARQNGFKVLVINNDTDMDPDEIIRKYGPERLKEMIAGPKTWMEFVFAYFRKQYDLSNYSSRKEFASRVMAEINQLTDSFDRDNYLDQLSQLTGFATGILTDNMSGQKETPAPQIAKRDPERYRTRIMDGETLAERTVIKQMLMSRKMCDLYKFELKYLRDRQANALALHIIDYYNQHEELIVSEFVGQLEDEQLKSLAVDIVESSMIPENPDEQAFRDAALKIRKSILDSQIRQLRQQLKETDEQNRKTELSSKIGELIKKKKSLEENRRGSNEQEQ